MPIRNISTPFTQKSVETPLRSTTNDYPMSGIRANPDQQSGHASRSTKHQRSSQRNKVNSVFSRHNLSIAQAPNLESLKQWPETIHVLESHVLQMPSISQTTELKPLKQRQKQLERLVQVSNYHMEMQMAKPTQRKRQANT